MRSSIPPAEEEPGSESAFAANMLKSASSPKVLVVEDEPFLRMATVDCFIDAGFDVLEAVTGDEAMAVVQAHPDIRAVFTDVEMPGALNGVALANTLRKRWPAIAIIVTSGRGAPSAGLLPADVTFLDKPYSTDEVIHRIRSLAARRSIQH